MKIFVKDLKNGDFITDQYFSVMEYQRHKAVNGSQYYRVKLCDRTGEIQAKIWESSFSQCNMNEIKIGDIVLIDGDVQEYQGKNQLIVKKLFKTENYDIADIIKSSEKDLNEMFNKILETVNNIEDTDIKRLLQKFFKDEDFVNRYKKSPASMLVHHDFVGGLMEHVLEMLSLADALLSHYQDADPDLVHAGIILHDIGKLWEFELKGGVIDRTKKGILITHIPLALEYIIRNLPDDFPEDKWIQLHHIILSHQEKLELGAVVNPATLEAAIVAMVDNDSAFVRQYQTAKKVAKESGMEFSEYQRRLGSQVYSG